MKKNDEGKTKTMENSVRKETVKKDGKKVEFSFHAPWAKEVFLAGEFNYWDIRSMPLKRGKAGNWKAQTSLPPGRYEYKFIVDNHWVEDLPDMELAANSFGTKNIVLWVE
jgi:1,4-alpha-glucan branching enzyme